MTLRLKPPTANELGMLLLAALILWAVAVRAAEPGDAGACSAPAAFVAHPDGFRRMPPEHVTHDLVLAARGVLQTGLVGDLFESDGFAIAIECHYDEGKGWHPGASLFERVEPEPVYGPPPPPQTVEGLIGQRSKVARILLSMPVFRADKETDAQRNLRLDDLATDLTEYTDDPEELAVLLAIGERESGFAGYIGADHCEKGPPGARCDDGKAKSYFQLQRPFGAPLWLASGHEFQLASIMLGLGYWKRGYDACQFSIEGAFAHYKGRACDHHSGRSRARLYRKRLCQLTTLKPWPEVLKACAGVN